MSVYIGIDPSLTGTAVAIIDGDGIRTSRLTTKPDAGTPASMVARLDKIERWVAQHLDSGQIAVGVEGPAYSQQVQAGVHARAGLWWRLVTRALMHADQVHIIAPTSLKRYAVGVGAGPRASKDAVLLAVAKRYPHADIASNDESDALVIAAMVARLHGHPIDDPLPQANLAAMAALTQEPM